MKQYLLLLRSSDFEKSGNIWTSSVINLYSNSSYKNYSNKRHQNGLDLIGDRTFVGTEVTSPSFSANAATPYSENAIYATNFGEVIYESATPSLLRFIDTTSRIDILSYKHLFTNIPGSFIPTFNIDIYESDDGDINGPWLKSAIASDSNTLFIRNSKPFIKIQLEIYAPDININTLGLIFYLEVGIHDPSSPVISTTGKNILKRFPSWTAVFEDSIDSATPELDIPQSVGGKFLTALTQDTLDLIADEIDLHGINSYLNSANEDTLAWIYASYNVPANIINIRGDGIELAKVSTLQDFLESRPTDYVYYHSLFDRRILTIRSFETLTVNGIEFEQEPQNVFNEFDEFGARVSLPRLYLESNTNYKKRILDVNKNIPAINMEGFKRTLRRELDIWRAYGATPDSDYLGATPEVLEISDIEISTPYFDDMGRPHQIFKNLVDDINSKYPSNFGYVRWEEGVWDYAGLLGEGVGRIPAIYDIDATPFSNYYQGGVGDFNDAKVLLEQVDAATVSFEGSFKISGLKNTGNINYYVPISGLYSWYMKYTRSTPNYEAGGLNDDLGVALVYEIDMPAHDNYTTPSTFYANLNYYDRPDFYVGNRFSQNSSASPEYNYIKIFDQEGLSLDEIEFKDKVYDEVYLNTESTPSSNSLSVYDATEVRVFFNKQWIHASQNFTVIPVANYRFAFNQTTPIYISEPSNSATANISSPNIDYINSNLLIGSTVYQSTPGIFYSDVLQSYYHINSKNGSELDGKSYFDIVTQDLIDAIIYPPDATPNTLYIEVAESSGLDLDTLDGSVVTYVGGLTDFDSSYLDFESNRYVVPSSPNIKYSTYVGSNPYSISSTGYFESISLNMSSTPAFIRLSTENVGNYPFKFPAYETFSAESTPGIYSGFINSINNTYKDSSEVDNYYISNDYDLEDIYINKQTFGLHPATPYIIQNFTYATTPSYIKVWDSDSTNDADLPIYINHKFELNDHATINMMAKRDDESDTYRKLALHTGWLYIDNNDYYVYANPKVQNSNGRLFEIKLDDTPRLGAPIIVKIGSENYRNIVFEDSATPGKYSFYNTEIVKSTGSNSLYLAYPNISDISIKDTSSGITLFNNLSSSTPTITPFSEATPAVAGREYEVIYLVNKAYHVEKDQYNEQLDKYESYIYFSSTPSDDQSYSVIYETDYLNKYMEIDVELDQSNNPLSEGYLYISKDEYNFNSTTEYLAPKYVGDSVEDFMYFTIISYDENGNPKPNQTFRIHGDDIHSDPEYVTTNNNGLGYSVIYYDGDIPAIKTASTFYVEGIGAATPNGAPNSQTVGYLKEIDFSIKRFNNYAVEVKASSVNKNIEADGTTKISVVGKVYYRGRPLNAQVDLNWKQAGTIYSLFDNTYNLNSGSVTTELDGSFIIENQIVAQDKENPNNWFVSIQVANDEELRETINEIEEILTEYDITITGDIVYWYESYDNVHYANEQLPINNNFVHVKQNKSELISTPNFIFDHARSEDIIRYKATPDWTIPRWVPLRRFDQYQMGIFGSTPNYIEQNSNLHPDNGEM